MTPKPRPPWCRHCDETTRHVDTPDGPARCPLCHPMSPQTPAALRTREAALQAELDEVRRQLAALDAPDWGRERTGERHEARALDAARGARARAGSRATGAASMPPVTDRAGHSYDRPTTTTTTRRPRRTA